jgi:hypothetical protein
MTSARRFLKELIVAEPGLTLEQLNELLTQADHQLSPASIRSIRTDTLDTLRIAGHVVPSKKPTEGRKAKRAAAKAAREEVEQ